MSKRTKSLEKEWWDWLATAERLQSSLHEQTAALMTRSTKRVEQLQPQIERITEQLRETDARASDCAKRLAEEVGAMPTLRSLVQSLKDDEAESVQSLANRVITVGNNLEDLISKNQALLRNEMEYVDGTLALIARSAENQDKPYARKGKGAPVNVLVNEVA